MDDHQLALILAVLSEFNHSASTEWILKRAETFERWLVQPEDPPDTSWMETEEVKPDYSRDDRPRRGIQDTPLPPNKEVP